MEGTVFIFWNWLVAVDLFFAGISAGVFAISALAYFIGKEKYQNITRIGAYIAPFPLIIGLSCLIYDLESPHLFWKLMVNLQVHSIMSLGAWLLLIFSVISFINFYLWLPDRFDIVELIRKTPRNLDKWAIVRLLKTNPLLEKLHRKNLIGLRGWVSLIGLPIAFLVGIYTGVLLGVLTARPFWNNPMLPMLFLVSALNTGTASICLVGCFVKGFGGMSRERIDTDKFVIHSIDFFLMLLSMISTMLFVFGLYAAPQSSIEAANLIMGGEFTFLFWGLAVGLGILVPFALEVYELIPHLISRVAMREHNPWISGALTLSVLTGGFALRYVVVYAGQAAQIIAT